MTRRIEDISPKLAQSTMDYLKGSKKLKANADTGCIEASISMSGDYCQVQLHVANPKKGVKKWVPVGKQRLLVHQIAYKAVHGTSPPKQHDISHLCHNSRCCNTEHLTIETHTINMERKACPGRIIGVAPCTHDLRCNKFHPYDMQLCCHDPPCLHKRYH